MKCIHCGSDSKLKDRTANGRRCTACLHPFAFEPTTDARRVTDGMFQRCIKDVSGDGALYYTEKQLWYEMNRRLFRNVPHIPRPYGIGAGVFAAGGAVGIIAGSAIFLPVGLAACIATLMVGAAVGKKNPQPRRVTLSFDEFRTKYLAPYRQAHGSLEKLLPPLLPIARSQPSPDSTAPPDLASYSFDRALITDHAETAAMLVANRFHFENNCAILSRDGRYPDNGRFDTILEMLKRNPDLTVFAIHDASREGMKLPLDLRAENWFPERSVRIMDLGLRPIQVMKGGFMLTGSATAVALPREIAASLKQEEATWLTQGNIAELAALRPARLMRAIYLGFNQAAAMTASAQDEDERGIIFVGGYGYGPNVWVAGGGGGTGVDASAADSFG